MTNVDENKKSAQMTREMQMKIFSVFMHIKERQAEVSAQMPEKWTVSVENAKNLNNPVKSMLDDSDILTVKREDEIIFSCAKSQRAEGPDSISVRKFVEGGVQRQLVAVIDKVVECAIADKSLMQDMREKRIEEIDNMIGELSPAP